MSDVDYVLGRIDTAVALDRIATIDTPILVIGRDDDHLQGIFRSTYVLLEQAGKDVEWVSYDHPVHGFVFPFAGPDGRPEVDSVQEAAIDRIISFLSHRFG